MKENKRKTQSAQMAMKPANSPVYYFMSALAKKNFLAIEKVLDVKVIEKGSQLFDCSVLVEMPQYDDALMDRLIETEIKVDKQVHKKGCFFQYFYLPARPDQIALINSIREEMKKTNVKNED